MSNVRNILEDAVGIIISPMPLAPEMLKLIGEALQELGGDPGELGDKIIKQSYRLKKERERWGADILEDSEEFLEGIDPWLEKNQICIAGIGDCDTTEVGGGWIMEPPITIYGWDLQDSGRFLYFRPYDLPYSQGLKDLLMLDRTKVLLEEVSEAGIDLMPWGGVQPFYKIVYRPLSDKPGEGVRELGSQYAQPVDVVLGLLGHTDSESVKFTLVGFHPDRKEFFLSDKLITCPAENFISSDEAITKNWLTADLSARRRDTVHAIIVKA